MKYFFPFLIFIIFSACDQKTSTGETDASQKIKDYTLIGGKTMGTTYSVKYDGGNPTLVNQKLDSLFKVINNAVSVYEEESVISKFNKAGKGIFKLNTTPKLSVHFLNNFEKSLEVYKKTDGYFDPTVMPFVNYWGFGYTGKKKVNEDDRKNITKILKLQVGIDKFKYDDFEMNIDKLVPGVQLDFGALAKGYGVDEAVTLLSSMGFKNFLVEIGGEVATRGKNPNGEEWVIGVNTPKENAKINDFNAYLKMSGRAMATSGNYRNFYEMGGEVYSHTINPKTGFPERSHLLSATIIADDCMEADAYATACMAGGLEKAINWVKNEKSIEGYFIYTDKIGNLQASYTDGFQKYIKN